MWTARAAARCLHARPAAPPLQSHPPKRRPPRTKKLTLYSAPVSRFVTECRRGRVLSYEEQERLFRELERYPEVTDATVIALNTGLRRMGILKLRVEDFDAAARTVAYVAKGGKVKAMPLNSEAFAVVSRLATAPAPGG